jgi:transposase-like protein
VIWADCNVYVYTNSIKLGITSLGKTFSIGFAFLPNESTEAYEWALSQFKNVGINPPIMVMDGSDGLKSAAEAVYPNMPALLCTWHINKCIVAHCKGYFTTNKEWEAFYNAWQRLIQSPTLDEFDE